MIIIPFPLIPILQLRFIPTIFFGAGFIFNCRNEKGDYGAFLNIYAQAEVSMNMELGLYIPGGHSPVELSISVGLKGVLGSGTIGLKIEYNLNQNQLTMNLNNILEAFALYFYIQYRFTINLKFYTYSFEFYIVNQRLFGYLTEEHKVINYKFLK